MGMKQLKEVREFLGPMYSVKMIDKVESIYRRISDRFDFEITGFFGRKGLTVNLWQRKPHLELLAIYSGIKDKESLSDALGYLSFKYQNLADQIQVEREDPAQLEPILCEKDPSDQAVDTEHPASARE